MASESDTNKQEFDLAMTRRALELADLGRGQVSPGPLVGCVVVDSDGKVVGEGTYLFENVTHAEVIALGSAGAAAKGGTAYISLEPHSHHGRTGPCTEALIEAGIKRVVVPIEDPNPLVSGKGFSVLEENGIEVKKGLLREKAEQQNEKFIHWHKHRRPFVHVKIASSLDGKCATSIGDSQWITGTESRNAGQRLRYEYDSILVGKGTVIADDPNLTDRTGLPRHRKLRRVILDSALSLGFEFEVVKSAVKYPSLMFCGPNAEAGKKSELTNRGVEVCEMPLGTTDLHSVLDQLADADIQSVLVEGGPTVSGSFFDAGLVDKVTFFIAPILIGGVNAPCALGGSGVEHLAEAYRLENVSISDRDGDIEITGYPKRQAP